jgi:Fic family protein
MTDQLQHLLDRIDSLKKEIDALRPLSVDVEGKIFQKIRLDWSFHSNAIEGNTLTYGETVSLLMDGLTALGKPIKDHEDIRGHHEAINFIISFIERGDELTERDIRELHEMILVKRFRSKAKTSDGQWTEKWIEIGQYKTQPNSVETPTGEMFYFASPEETAARMHDLVTWYRENRGKLHPLVLAARFHYDFVMIHPFDDGNGRMSRLLMNFILMEFGFLPAIVRNKNRNEYIRALRQANNGDIDAFILFIGQNLEDTMNLYLRGANGEDISDPDDLDKEIEMLKMSFEKNNLVKLGKTNDSVKNIISTSVYPLFKLLREKGRTFDELFLKTEHSVFAKSSNVSQEVAIKGIDELKDSQRVWVNYASKNFIRLDFIVWKTNFLGFSKVEYPFNVHNNLSVNFSEFHYHILYRLNDESVKFDKHYHEQLTELEISKIANFFIKGIIEMIKRKTE